MPCIVDTAEMSMWVAQFLLDKKGVEQWLQF